VSYFSQKEFETFVAEEVGRVNVRWLALSGRMLTDRESEELRRRLEEFFCLTCHRSFRKHKKA